MIKNFTPQAFPLWVVDFGKSEIAEIVIGWQLNDDGTMSPIASGTTGLVRLVEGTGWAIYADHAEAQADASPSR